MKTATRMLAVGAVAALMAFAALPAFADETGEPVLGFYGYGTLDAQTGLINWSTLPGVNVPVIVYDNTLSAALFAVSSTDLASVWGDHLLTTGTGVLTDMKFSIFNSASSAGALLTASVNLGLSDFATSAPFGSFGVNVNFGAGLNPGFYSIVTVTNLAPFGINVATTDIVALQTVTGTTGAATRLGIASLDPPTVGSSPTSMYVSSATIGGGVPGYYTFVNGPANPGYQLTVDAPVPNKSSSWGRLKSLYR